MSKQELQQLVYERSGVSHEESCSAALLVPSIYERVGGETGIRELSELFYDRVFNDGQAKWFLNIFASSTRDEAVDNQYRFLVQTFGGPELYRHKKGKYARLAGRHANYQIRPQAADRWAMHMKAAMKQHSYLSVDDEARDLLDRYFLYTAHYIVVASEFMRPDQLSGGTSVDSGRVW